MNKILTWCSNSAISRWSFSRDNCASKANFSRSDRNDMISLLQERIYNNDHFTTRRKQQAIETDNTKLNFSVENVQFYPIATMLSSDGTRRIINKLKEHKIEEEIMCTSLQIEIREHNTILGSHSPYQLQACIPPAKYHKTHCLVAGYEPFSTLGWQKKRQTRTNCQPVTLTSLILPQDFSPAHKPFLVPSSKIPVSC